MLAVLIKMATSFNLSTMHQQDLLQANQFYDILCMDTLRKGMPVKLHFFLGLSFQLSAGVR
jgi:hypothetical protein